MLNIDVCIMSYNRGDYLREAILSVLNQTCKAQNITVYDNGSDKAVYEQVKDLIGEKVRWNGAEKNQRYSWNFRRALKESTSKYVMMLHDDDRLCPNFLETQYREIENNKGMVAISCNGFLIEKDGKRKGGYLEALSQSRDTVIMSCSGMVAIKYASKSCIPFSPAIYLKEVAQNTPLRDEYTKVGDAVYFCDLAEKGSIGYNPLPMYECRKHEKQDSVYFPYEEMKSLGLFFQKTKFDNEEDRLILQKLLKRQEAIRIIWQMVSHVKRGEIKSAFNFFRRSQLNFMDFVDAIGHRFFQKIQLI